MLTTATEICKQDTVLFLGRRANGRIGPRGFWIIVPQKYLLGFYTHPPYRCINQENLGLQSTDKAAIDRIDGKLLLLASDTLWAVA